MSEFVGRSPEWYLQQEVNELKQVNTALLTALKFAADRLAELGEGHAIIADAIRKTDGV